MEDYVCGIYKISNKENNKVYIGMSVDVHNRMKTHKWNLGKNNHINNRLQDDFNIYGANSFVYEIIEECNEDILKERETYWINYYNSLENGYNLTDYIKGQGKNQNRVIQPVTFSDDEQYLLNYAKSQGKPFATFMKDLIRKEMGEIANLLTKEEAVKLFEELFKKYNPLSLTNVPNINDIKEDKKEGLGSKGKSAYKNILNRK